ncbi:MAG: ATP-binding protein [Caldisericia bacterium]|jgi:hypothetical protein|nr:ATP-binding protein [Caldisericia bacterium]
MQEIINITPDTSLLPKLGKSGYSTAQAIAELVDNSIDAINTTKQVGEINITIDKSFIKVYDNGSGMTKEELINSLRLAKSNKQNQLGRFGLGLKTAALSLGSYFSITTKSTKENFLYTVNYDEERWKEHSDWTIPLEYSENNGGFSFTEILIKSLKNKIPVNTIDKIKLDIGQRYAPFIQNGEINVYVNKQKCFPLPPVLLEGTKRDIKIPFLWEGKKLGTITGWVGLLKEGSNKGNYGFTTYWMNRMITTYDKIAIGEHPTISRVIGEIHLDFLEPTHDKREFIKESPMYEYVVELLKEDLKDILREAKKKASVDTVTPQIQDSIQKYTEITLEVLNSDNFFREFTRKMTDNKYIRNDSGDETIDASVEKREKDEIESPNLPNEKEPFKDLRTPSKIHTSLRKGISIKGEYFKFVHMFQNLGKEESMKIGIKNEETKNIEIYTNIDFPSYQITKDKAYYGFMNIADYIAELYCSEIEGSNYTEIREVILRKVGNYIEQMEN